MPGIADQNGLQQKIDTKHMEMTTFMKEMRAEMQAVIGDIGDIGDIGEMKDWIQGQLREMKNEYVSLSSFG